MKAIYSGCILDPWLRVAKKLKNEHNIEPVYWIGWNKENEDKIVKAEFPNIIFQDLADSWRGIFADGIKKFEQDAMLDGEFLIGNAFHELMAMKMMDRMDPDRHSFNFDERQRHYRMLLRRWMNILETIKPDLIISASIPHRIYDYALYVAAKSKGVKFICFQLTNIPNFLLPLTDVYSLPKTVFDYKKHNIKYSDLTLRARNCIENTQKDYKSAIPSYVRRSKKAINHYKPLSIFRDLLNDPLKYVFFVANIFKVTKTCFKKRNSKIEGSEFSFFDVEIVRWKGRRYKKGLKKYYNSKTRLPNLDDKYILVALHYQPEATSTPSGSVYTDQFLMIDMISKAIPEGWKIYVKEHPSQFHPLSEGEMGRCKNFYDDILKLKNTQLIQEDYDSFELIDNSKAVATILGTIGFEAVVRGKPVLAFGNAWYSPISQVFSVKNKEDLIIALSECEKFTKNNISDLYKYIYHLENDIGIYAYHYKGEKEGSAITEEESIEALSRSIIDNLKTEKIEKNKTYY